jgi:hemerythrin-like domain-containing protein
MLRKLTNKTGPFQWVNHLGGEIRHMSYRLDNDEDVLKVIDRLKEEHRDIDRKLSRIAEICRDYEGGKLKVALSLLRTVSTEILRHAVEEEAIVARIIMKSKTTKEDSIESVSILQEHRRIKEFFEDKLPFLANELSESKVRKEILEFIDEIITHHKDEESVVFPLAQKANLLLSAEEKWSRTR